MVDLNFKEVRFTGNFIRFNPVFPERSNQGQNINWLKSLVTPHLKILGIDEPIKDVKWEEDGKNDLYKVLNLVHNLSNYLDIYLGEHNSVLSDHLSELFSGALIIGFELPPFLIQFFDARRIPYIDVILGPLRFFPDLVPAMRSNVPAVVSTLKNEVLSEHEIRIVAGCRKAYFAKRKLDVFEEGTVLLVGQVPHDTSQIVDGKFVSLQDYEAKIQSLCNDSKVIFKTHPYVSRTEKRAQMKMMRRNNIDVVDNNIYELLCSEGICKVASVSSSVLLEAPYFDMHGEGFIDYPFPFSTGESVDGIGRFFNIYGRICDTRFWASVLGEVDFSQRLIKLPTGMLAESLGQSWGASIFTSSALSVKKTTLFEQGLQILRKFGKFRD